MFKISPVQDKEAQTEYAAACGCEYRDGAFAYVMKDAESGNIMGFSQFEISSDHGMLYDLRPASGSDDFEAMFILGRSTMNFIDLCGVNALRAYKSSADEKLLKAIGLKRLNENEYFCDMTGFFDGSHCSSK